MLVRRFLVLAILALAAPAAAADRPPDIVAPASVSGVENAEITFTATASDPDGQPIEAMSATYLPSGAVWEQGADYASGTFRWTPDGSQAGVYRIAISASSACRAVPVSSTVDRLVCVVSEVPVEITVAEGDNPPILEWPSSVEGFEGELILFRVGASDPDGDLVTSLTATPLPAGATFQTSYDNGAGVFEWVPQPGQAGDYPVTFTASNALTATCVVPIHVVAGPDRPPVVTAPAAVTGPEGAFLSFTCTASDPDGQPIDALTADPLPPGARFEVSPSHDVGLFTWTPTLVQAGVYHVELAATSACRPSGVSGASVCESGVAATTITIENTPIANVPGTAFVTNANEVIRLGSGRATWCVQVEPTAGAFDVDAIEPGSVVLIYGAGTIAASSDAKSAGVGDVNRNGIVDLTVCFTKDDLRTLFGWLPRGTNTVTVAIEGDLTNGDRFRAELTVDVAVKNSARATVAPNPLNPSAMLSFETHRAGFVGVVIYDLQGRLVRRVLNREPMGAGHHEVPIDGADERGARLPSGVYFYRVESADGISVGRFVVAK